MTRPPARLASPMFGSAAGGFCEAISSHASTAATPPGPSVAPLFCRDARGRDGAVVEREQRDDGQRGDLADALDRVDQLLEVVERLDHEEVGAPALEHRRLLGEELMPDPGARRLAQRADRAPDEDVAADRLAGL